MAANLGSTSLADVHHEGLDEVRNKPRGCIPYLLTAQILHYLAKVYPTSPGHETQLLGVPAIDALLEVFMLNVTGPSMDPIAQQLSRQQNTNDDHEMLLQGDEHDVNPVTLDERAPPPESDLPSNVFFSHSANRSNRPSPVLEISSRVSAAGKTQLLYYLTALAVLPGQHGDLTVGGHEAAVVYIDADDRFDAERLRIVARSLVQQAQISNSEKRADGHDTTRSLLNDEVDALVTHSLQHVHVFRPQSSSALLATLSSLHTYLYDLSRHYSASRRLQIIVIDSVTAFFWQDRLRDEVARTENIGRPRAEIDEEREQKKSFCFADLYAEMAKVLKQLKGRFGCAVVYTTTVSAGRFPASSKSGQSGPLGPYDQAPSRTPSLRPALPAPWGTFPTLRLVVHRDTVRSFPPGMSAHDARRDAPVRQSVVRQGKFSAWVNAWAREEWPRRVVDGVDFHNGGCFSFYVRETGVEIPRPDS